MGVNIKRLLSLGLSNKQRAGQAVSTEYYECLRYYWSGDYQTALNKVTEAIASNPEGDNHASLYRLWIEILADQSDMASLAALRDHLLNMGHSNPDERDYYAALRGITHYELDEYDAASLMSRATSGKYENPYCLELEQLVEQRLSVGPTTLPLAKSAVSLSDYFHWNTLARSLYEANDESLGELLSHVTKLFADSPLQGMHAIHSSFEKGEYHVSSKAAEKLCKLYPETPEYKFYYGYSLFHEEKYERAKDQLNQVVYLSGENDPDTQSLLGHCYEQLGEHVKAVEYLQRSVSLLKSHGLPSSAPGVKLTKIQQLSDENYGMVDLDEDQPPKMWLINLSARDYHKLQTSPVEEVAKISWPMGVGPKTDELCFFAAPSRDESWRIAAIYTVESESMWHPIDRYQTPLQLISRPSESIPVEVHVLDENHEPTSQELGKDHPYSFGVFELEMGALDIITEAIRVRNESAEEAVDLDTVKRSS